MRVDISKQAAASMLRCLARESALATFYIFSLLAPHSHRISATFSLQGRLDKLKLEAGVQGILHTASGSHAAAWPGTAAHVQHQGKVRCMTLHRAIYHPLVL